jgi:hypothetical protein
MRIGGRVVRRGISPSVIKHKINKDENGKDKKNLRTNCYKS